VRQPHAAMNCVQSDPRTGQLVAEWVLAVHTRLRLRDVGSPLRSSRRLTLILAKAVGRFRLRRLLRCFFARSQFHCNSSDPIWIPAGVRDPP
jgi:hypothetical protein